MLILSSTTDPTVSVTILEHPSIVVGFDLFYTDPDHFTINYLSSYRSLQFSDAVSLDDIHFNNDGSGNLVLSVTSAGQSVLNHTFNSFEDGVYITGWTWGYTPAAFDGTSELIRPDQPTDPLVIPTEWGTFVFYPVTPVNYTISDFTVGGVTYDLTQGVPVTGTDADETLSGFDVRDFNGQAYNDVVDGRAGNDTLYGKAGADTLFGGDGDDRLDGGSGVDLLDGGSGNDIAVLDYSTATAAINAVIGTADGSLSQATIGGMVSDRFRDIEGAQIIGGSGDDRLGAVVTGWGSYFEGSSGADVLVLDMSSFSASVVYSWYYNGLIQDGDPNKPKITVSGFEGFELTGGSGNDYLGYTGATLNSILKGGDGNDSLLGGSANDTLSGGEGDDYLSDGRGSNVLDGGAGLDTLNLDYSVRTGNIVFVASAVSDATFTSTVAGVATDKAKDFERFTLIGGSGDDRLGAVVTDWGSYFEGSSGADVLVLDMSSFTASVVYSWYYNGLIQDGDPNKPKIIVSGFEGFELTGGSGNDYLGYSGATLNSILKGGDGNDSLLGGSANDTLSGGEGDDYLSDGRGSNVLDGGAGLDTLNLDYSVRTGNIVFVASAVSDATFTSTVAGVATDKAKDFERFTLIGGSGNDRLGAVVTGWGSYFEGSSGADVLVLDMSSFTENIVYSWYYNGLIQDGDPNKPKITVSGFEGFELTGGSGNDYLGYTGATLNSILKGGGGNDMLSGGSGNDTLSGGEGDDYLSDGRGSNVLDGGAGLDTLNLDYSLRTGNIVFVASAVSDATFTSTVAGVATDKAKDFERFTLIGGSGDDRLGAVVTDWGSYFEGSSGEDVLVLDMSSFSASILYSWYNNGLMQDGDPNKPKITVSGFEGFELTGGSGNDYLGYSGATLNSILKGGDGNDSLQGGSANDTLSGGRGADSMYGGNGDDRYSVDDAGDVVVEYFNAGIDTVESSVSYALSDNVENLVLTGALAINGTGNAMANQLLGNGAANLLDGGAGADTMTGGKGDDTYMVDNAGDKVIEADGGGSDMVNASVTYSLAGQYVEVLNLLDGAANGTGNGLNNRIVGNSAANLLVGAEGNDRLDGGAGADTLKGGLGNDTYVVDNMLDRIVENDGEGIDTVEASFTYSIAGQYIEILKLMGTGDFNATGNGLANTLYGNTGNNTLNGGAGTDTMYGGAGDDTYIVDNGGDRVFENANEGTDTVQSSVSFSINGQYVENLTLTGASAINGTGNSQANTLNGNAATNVLNGGAGNDALHGGLGSDTLIGGAGQDSYWFETTLGAGNVDTISDFNAADDTIMLDRSVFKALAAEGALDPTAFWQGSAAHDADDRIVYDKATGKIYYDADGSGAGAAVLFAQVTANTALTAADFLAVP